MNKIYIFGNPLLDFDNTPILLKSELKKEFPETEFCVRDPNENLHPKNGKLIIIDTAEGIEEVRVLTDISKIQVDPKYSMHDFDLGFNLRLLEKIGQLKEVVIFCVPMKIEKKQALNDLVTLIKKEKTG